MPKQEASPSSTQDKIERFLEAFALLARVRLGLYFRPNATLKTFKTIEAQDYQVRLIGATYTQLSARQLSHDIVRASKCVPQATCLVQALAGKALLARHSYATELKLGVIKKDNLKAHAWLEHDDSIILGHVTNLSDYSVLKANTL